jgi:RsiW-degrading membrane proteinase PrsW (M82 family)
MTLLTIALAPVFILLLYIYFRDKYDKEPIGLLLKGLFFGALITVPIVFMEGFFSAFGKNLTGVIGVAYKSFVVAGFTEELFKYMAVMFVFWRHKAFDERFDGIVYAAFVSLGFAAVENILYVFEHGTGTGILRALTAVPGHLLFGVTMGYYIGLARFMPEKKNKLLFRALFIPIFLHGFYNFMLFSGHPLMLILFIPFIIYLWRTGLKKMRSLSFPHEQFIQDMERDEEDPPLQSN